jgi:hypothetical protein
LHWELNPPLAAHSLVLKVHIPRQWAAWDEGNRIGLLHKLARQANLIHIDEPEEEGGLNKLHLTQ